MTRLSAAHLAEVADWMRHWQPSRRVEADPARSRILAEGTVRPV